MNVRITPVRLGFDQCYILQGEGVVLVDAGAPGKGAVFRRELERSGLHPGDVRLVVITHGHWDHIGSAGEIAAMTGAPLAMHELEGPWLEGSRTPLSAGVTFWGRVMQGLVAGIMPLIRVPPAKVDLRITGAGLRLDDYGVRGRVIHTPGHSAGSVSVLLDSGEAFVGDLAMNRFPLRLTPGLPIFAEDEGLVRESWDLLLREGARVVYPAHGKPFPARIMRKALETGR
ncbi:MAG: MBL fold metallo-hydrolase [bacterium]|nr:MAG: MBL fold metallo-hydrolase [bacterium]